jgi:hypothetical protein
VPDEVNMPHKTIQLTAKGLAKIQEELRYLKEERRQELSDYMGAALADGDLRENAAYDEARLLQSANETRIADLEEIVARAVVVEHVPGATPSPASAPASTSRTTPARRTSSTWWARSRPTCSRTASPTSRRWASSCSAAARATRSSSVASATA